MLHLIYIVVNIKKRYLYIRKDSAFSGKGAAYATAIHNSEVCAIETVSWL
ncbi:hypothetical protein KSZ_63950 [Dictyobacter formicarum]|uniref:Uncharacterized protein n=1 Tax=Dictyobacter formicarum TaxID=2778368 RepID=A0ABQ3VRR8_9CHLR|nr:hypothetical protein KSZ_63950 [Dictyobacter formicarum]